MTNHLRIFSTSQVNEISMAGLIGGGDKGMPRDFYPLSYWPVI